MKKSPDISPEGHKSKASQRLSAKGKALSYLSKREHSLIELNAKLSRAGYEDAEITEALDWVKANRYQSDDRFASSLMRRRAKGYGDRAIQVELSQHHIEVETRELSENELGSEQDRALEWLRRRQMRAYLSILESETDRQTLEMLKFKFKAKCFRSLSHRGFEFRNIEYAWNCFVSEFSSDRC